MKQSRLYVNCLSTAAQCGWRCGTMLTLKQTIWFVKNSTNFQRILPKIKKNLDTDRKTGL